MFDFDEDDVETLWILVPGRTLGHPPPSGGPFSDSRVVKVGSEGRSEGRRSDVFGSGRKRVSQNETP